MDEPSIQLKIGREAIDNSSFSVQPDPIISTDGRHWKATYQISQQDSGTLEWIIAGIDRAGNPLGLSETDNVSTLGFNVYNNFSYEADNSSPLINVMSLVSSNTGKDYDNQSIKVAKAGDNLTVNFQTNEAIDTPTLELRFGGIAAAGLGSLTDDNQSMDPGRYWKGTYELSDNG